MIAYVTVTGTLFALLVGAHIWRLFYEPHQLRDPFFLATTLVAAGLAWWAWRLRRVTRGG